MAILVLEHDRHETSARLGQVLRDHGHRLRVVRLHEGDALPVDLDDVDGVVSMGGPMNVPDTAEHAWIEPEMQLLKAAHEAGLPMVGVCLGAQLIASALGGQVRAMPASEMGWHEVKLTFPGTLDPIYAGIPWRTVQFHSHGQEVAKLPEGATVLAGSELCKVQAFRVGLKVYGFQYHFEWTREEIEVMLATVLAEAGVETGPIRAQMDEHYDMYRHMGDRLCETLTLLLFPIDKRPRATMRPVKNWDAAVS